MRLRQLLTLTALTLVAVFTLAPTARANEFNKLTYINVKEPIEVSGRVLVPGQYVMKLFDSPSNRHVVEFYRKSDSKLVATILAVPNTREEPTGKTKLTWYETPAGQPFALRGWFYPGDTIGQRFVYSGKHSMKNPGGATTLRNRAG